MLPQEIIRKKRNGETLTEEEIEFFVKGVSDWSISECQVAAFCMAVFLRNMRTRETTALTRAMTHSGTTLSWAEANLDGPILDKHSTGGVGDKVSLMLAPILVACGGYVPMISGRGLGHTGGTLDKLDSIPGYDTAPDLDEFRDVIKKAGCAIIGQTSELAPADKRMYAIRDVTATVESIPLITASILSKKLAAGLDALVMDLKVGNGAFMETMENARKLGKFIVSVAGGAGLPASAILTDMNQVLGHTAGNAVEVREAVDFLRGDKQEPRLLEVTRHLCAEALVLKSLAKNTEEALKKVDTVLENGKAAEIFGRMVAELGGPPDFMEKMESHLPKAPVIRPVYASRKGYVGEIDTRAFGLAVVTLGGGRTHPNQDVDHAVGLSDIKGIGDPLNDDSPIAVVHAASESGVNAVADALRSAVFVDNAKPAEKPAVLEKIQGDAS